MPEDSAAGSAVGESEAGVVPADGTADDPAVEGVAAEPDAPVTDEPVTDAPVVDEPAADAPPPVVADEPDTFLTAEAMEFFAVARSGTAPAEKPPTPPVAGTPVAGTFGVAEIFRAAEATQFITAPKPEAPSPVTERVEPVGVVRDPDDAETVVFAGVLDLDEPAEPSEAAVVVEHRVVEQPGNNPAALVGVFTMILCAVLGLGLLSRIDGTRQVPGRAVAAPYTAAMAPTSAEAVRPRPVQRLEDHPLLLTPRPLPEITCELPAFGTSDQQLADYYAAGVVCLDTAWAPVLKDANLPFEPPSLDAAPELSNGPCGAAPASEDAVAYYCGRNRMIYMPTSRLRENGGGDRPATHLATLAHEYGHHVQAMTGMLRAADLKIVNAGEKTPAGLEMSRRIELQANCFAGMFLGAAAGRGSITTDLARRAEEDFQYAMEESPEKNAHGSPTNQGDWALSGFEANSTDACNTYAAPAGAVG